MEGAFKGKGSSRHLAKARKGSWQVRVPGESRIVNDGRGEPLRKGYLAASSIWISQREKKCTEDIGLCGRISQAWHYQYLGLNNSLLCMCGGLPCAL